MAKLYERMVASGWANFFLRLVIGFGFAAHGWAKLSRGPSGFGEILGHIGVPFPQATAWITTLIELGGGVALMLGAFVVLFSVPLAATMLTAMFTVHLPYGFSSIRLKAVTPGGAEFGPPGYEVNLLYLAGLLALVLGGAGCFSIDGWRRNKASDELRAER